MSSVATQHPLHWIQAPQGHVQALYHLAAAHTTSVTSQHSLDLTFYYLAFHCFTPESTTRTVGSFLS